MGIFVYLNILLFGFKPNLFGIDFPLHPLSQFPFLAFSGQEGQQNKGKGAQRP